MKVIEFTRIQGKSSIVERVKSITLIASMLLAFFFTGATAMTDQIVTERICEITGGDPKECSKPGQGF